MKLDWRVPIFLTAALFGLFGSTGFSDANAPFETTYLVGSVANGAFVPPVMDVDSNGRAVFLYYKEERSPSALSGGLWLYRCGDAACTSGTNTEVVANGVSNTASLGLTIDASDFAVIAYPGASSTTRILRCSNLACTGSKTDFALPGVVNPNPRSVGDIELSNDRPAIVLDVSGQLKYVRCLIPDCSTGATSNVVAASGSYPQIEFTTGGLPVITYQSNGLQMVFCNDILCAAGGETSVTVDAASGFGFHGSLVLNSTGRPLISYANGLNNEVRLAICPDATCSTAATLRPLATGTSIGAGTAIALKNGIPIVAFKQNTVSNAGTMLVRCDEPTCATWESSLIDGPYANSSVGNTRPSLSYRSGNGYYAGFFQQGGELVTLLRAAPGALGPNDDVDCSGTWTAQDALIILRMLAGIPGAPLPVAPCSSDIDGTPGTTLADALFARRKAAGLD